MLGGVHADGSLGLVENGGVAGGRGAAARILLARHLVRDRLRGRLLAIRHDVTARNKSVAWVKAMAREEEQDSPLGLVSGAGDSVGDLVGSRLGRVGGDLVLDL